MEPREDTPTAVGYHAALFLDILNQKEKLQCLSVLPNTLEERPAFISALAETYGVVHQYRAAFDTYLHRTAKAREDLKDLSPAAYEQFRAANEIQLKRAGFSDSIVCYTPLMQVGERIPILSVLHLMYAASGMFLAGLTSACPCRGGLDVGVGATFPDVGIYGPVLYQSYELESNVAGYPRIVVGVEFLNYIRHEAETLAGSPVEILRRKIAETCHDLIYIDTDGVPCLDYLGKPIRELMGPGDLGIDEAIEFATGELRRFQEEGNFKLAERYHRLTTYLRTRETELWSSEI